MKAEPMNVVDDDDHDDGLRRHHDRSDLDGDNGGVGGVGGDGNAACAPAPARWGGTHRQMLLEESSSNYTSSKKRGRDDMDYDCSLSSSSLPPDQTTVISSNASTELLLLVPALDELLKLAEGPNFEELARQYPTTFRTAWETVRRIQQSRGPHTSFSSCVTQSFTIQLSKALLKRLWNVEVPYLDEQHLCPPIPNRFFYVKWIYEELLSYGCTLLSSSSPSSQNGGEGKTRMAALRGLDIGTGASCIYPLLACNRTTLASVDKTRRKKLRRDEVGLSGGPTYGGEIMTMMYTTEVDEYAYQLACQNVHANRNHLPLLQCETDSIIQVLKVPPSYRQQQHQQQRIKDNRDNNDDDDQMKTDDVMNDDDIVHQPNDQVVPVPGGPLRRALDAISTLTTASSRNDTTMMHQQQSQLDFCMTNPPFYDSTPTSTSSTVGGSGENADESWIVSRPLEGNGRSRTQMTVSEGTYPGGEVGFVFDIFVDWYETLLAVALKTTSTAPTPSPLPLLSSSSLEQSNQSGVLLPPKWCSAMIGKKTSFQYIYKVLTRIVGFGNVRATEYGPGIYTRWFIAWRTPPLTPQSYSIRSLPSTLLPRHPTKDHFVVTIYRDEDDDGDTNNDMDHDQTDQLSHTARPTILTTVTARIEDYCDSNPGGWELKTISSKNTASEPDPSSPMTMTITERHPKPVVYYVDEIESTENSDDVVNDDLIPHEILQLLQQSTQQQQSNDSSRCFVSPQQSWLPTEGHFVIDIDLRTSQSSSSSSAVITVDVGMTCRRHSARGMKAIEKIRSTLEGEICRTNRKWRKIRQRRKQQQQQQRQT